jgi:UDP-2-acetamido-2,6-beta-L-arabino-hexul-4-ose reductase
MNILVTGANGFIGRNLVTALERVGAHQITKFDAENTPLELEKALAAADFVFHLAGVNRPETEDEFRTGNVDLTALVCARLLALRRLVPILLSSSTQAELDNPYGQSKREAESVVASYAEQSGARAIIYRLTNVFGKWCQPNYNSVVATFCHNIARGLPITISNPDHELELIHVDDVVSSFVAELAGNEIHGTEYRHVRPSYHVTLASLAAQIRGFREMRQSLLIPDFGDPFANKLYGTYLTYLAKHDFAYYLNKKCDQRGCLAEFVKGSSFGQIFVSRTEPGITRGDHYHDIKTEKFLVLEGEAVVRFRHILNGEVLEYSVRGEDFCVVDIPPGYTHSIENVGSGELITLFWASEIFEPSRPDTTWLPVLEAEDKAS